MGDTGYTGRRVVCLTKRGEVEVEERCVNGCRPWEKRENGTTSYSAGPQSGKDPLLKPARGLFVECNGMPIVACHYVHICAMCI